MSNGLDGMQTLWDFVAPLARPLARPLVRLIGGDKQEDGMKPPRDHRTRPKPKLLAPTITVSHPSHDPTSMQSRYDAVTRLMLDRYQLRVRKWRTAMSGVAWTVTYRDGTVSRLIEAPRPRGPMSAAVFLHEVGHHAIGFNVYSPRCLEEYHAWRWSLDAMAEHGLNITDQVRHRMHLSLWYAVAKANRRGLKKLPPELEPFVERPARPVSTKRKRKTASRPPRSR